MKKSLGQKFGEQVKILRKKKKISQEKLAEMIGLSARQLGRIENGICSIKTDILDKLSCYFETDLISLFAFDYESKYKRNSYGYVEQYKHKPDNQNKKIEYEKIRENITLNCKEMSDDIKKLDLILKIMEVLKKTDLN